MERIHGSVQWFNNSKGYGFLSRPDGPDVFVHFSANQAEGYKSFKEGDEVEYVIITVTKGSRRMTSIVWERR